MKLSDLLEKKKGPIIGAPKGSQKDARLKPGTDDPAKYMRGGEWEAYREPQGVHSDAGKIAGGQKKGTTKTKNKKTSESVYSDKTKFNYSWDPAMMPDPDGAPKPASYDAPKPGEDGVKHIVNFGVRDDMKGKAHRKDSRRKKKVSESADALYEILNMGVAFWYNPYKNYVVPESMWTDEGSSHSKAATLDLGIADLEGVEPHATDDYDILEVAMKNGWIRGLNYEGKLVLQGIDQQHAMDAYEALQPHLKDVSGMDGLVQAVEVGSLDGFEHTFAVESISEALVNDLSYYSEVGLAQNPDKNYVLKLMQQAVDYPTRDPHLKGYYDPRGSIWIWDGRGDTVHHAEIAPAILDKFGWPEFEEWMDVVGPSLAEGGVSEEEAQEYFDEEGGLIPIIIQPEDPQRGGIGEIWLPFSSVERTPEFRRALAEAVLREGTQMGIFPGGAGVSGDLVAKDRDVLTLADLEDTTSHTTDNKPMPNSKAPIKKAKATLKKSLTNTSGNTAPINETVRRTRRNNYDADYDLRNDADTETIGVAQVRDGLITMLAVRNDLSEDFNGHILSRLLGTLVRDADLANANLAIGLDDPDDIQHKRFLERFGFRETGGGVMKRNAGSITPPSVPTARI